MKRPTTKLTGCHKPAAAYYRMSSDAQEASIPAQREAVRAWAAANGWELVAEYQDDGISGDATAKRTAFKKMLADAQGKKFGAIIVWNLERFGRFDSIEGGYWLFPLREAGVQIITLDRGPIDWHDFGGRIIWSVEQEAKHSYLRTMSRDSLRGKIKAAREGVWQGGRCPLGYRVENRRLAEEPSHSAIVRRIFAEYLAGYSLRGIAIRLNDAGLLSARGAYWVPSSVRMILTNAVYLGDYLYNRSSSGKYVQSAGGMIRSKAAGDPSQSRNDEADWIRIAGHHPALIERTTFDAVQSRLVERQKLTTPKRNGGRFVFQGMVWCAGCGTRMCGYHHHGYDYYYCQSYMTKGREFCHRRPVPQAELLGFVLEALGERLTGSELRRAFRSEVNALMPGSARAADQVAPLTRELAGAEAERRRLQERLCDVDAEFVPVVQSKLRETEVRCALLSDRLKRARKPAKVLRLEADRQIELIVKMFGELSDAVAKAPPPLVRALLRELIERVEVLTAKVQKGTRGVADPHGTIVLRAELLENLVSTRRRTRRRIFQAYDL